MVVDNERNPFRIDWQRNNPLKRVALTASRGVVENLLGLSRLSRTYDNIRANRGTRSFEEAALIELGVNCSVPQDELERVPTTGPLVVVANHPFGGVEGLILTALLQRVRPDVKILSNELLHRIPELRESQIFVDVFNGPDSPRRNLSAMRTAISWLRKGHCLAVFPAGEVSHYSVRDRTVTDPPWQESIARLVTRSACSVVPVFFEGRNSRLFQTAGLIHPRMRTAMLGREVYNPDRRDVSVRIGRPIAHSRIARFATPKAQMAYLRLRTYLLRSGSDLDAQQTVPPAPAAVQQPIAPPEPTAHVIDDVAQLDETKRLLSSGPFDVYCAAAAEIPHLLQEIGRLREVTFRAVGEGSGLARDLDRFDAYYHHLFLWHRESNSLVGAYRIGRTDDILAAHGVGGLYTNTLFRFRPQLLREMGPALELGRSFVIKEFQKTYSPLLLLWKGIAQYLVNNPTYRSLFGAVSISDDYHSMTKQLLMTFLMANKPDAALCRLTRPRNPPRRMRGLDLDAELMALAAPDLKCVDELVSEIEADGKPMPVLLRQYLKLQGRLLGFNVDPAFGNVLDGLILVQLDEIDRPTLERYMGRSGAASYLRESL